MSERILINRIKKAQTQTGKPVVNLYANSRQQYPELVLFELGELTTVDIDPADLDENEHYPRFWAHYQVSEKLNKEGNPYRDVLYLEPINAPASTTSTDTSAIVAELRAIKTLLLQLVQVPGPEPARDPNGDRETFYTRTAQALADGIPQTTVDALLDVASHHGFALATECLAAENARKPGKSYDHRAAIVARLREMLALPIVASGQVTNKLEPGWEWTWSKAALLAEGKRLKEEMEGGEA